MKLNLGLFSSKISHTLTFTPWIAAIPPPRSSLPQRSLCVWFLPCAFIYVLVMGMCLFIYNCPDVTWASAYVWELVMIPLFSPEERSGEIKLRLAKAFHHCGWSTWNIFMFYVSFLFLYLYKLGRCIYIHIPVSWMRTFINLCCS